MDQSCFLPRYYQKILDPRRAQLPTLNLSDNIKSIKNNLIFWNTYTFGNLRKNIESLKIQIAQVQSYVPTTQTNQKLKELQSQLHHVLDCVELYWKQKLRDKWIKEGGRNTIFMPPLSTGGKEIQLNAK